MMLSVSLLFAQVPASEPVETTTCELVGTTEYGLVGDVSGKKVYTKIEKSYQCTTRRVEDGECIRSEVISEEVNTTANIYDIAYEEEMMSGSLGQMLGIMSATNQVNSIFSGWKGYCKKGIDEDFDWLSDPYMWAGLIMSAVIGEYGSEIGTAVVGEGASEATKKIAQKAVGAIQCTVQAGMDIGQMMSEGDDEIPCDPVDEFCDEDSASEAQEYSLPQNDFDDFMNDNPRAVEFITVTKSVGDVVYFKFVTPPMDDEADPADAEEAAKEAEEMMKKIKAAMIAITVAACYGAVVMSENGAALADTGQSAGSATSASNIAGTVGSLVGNALCGPVCGAAGALVGKLATSFTPINSCSDEDDAEAQGPRHASTFIHKKYGNCLKIRTECEIDDKLGGGCQLEGQHYCCYDQKTSLVLIQQIKAQLALDWQNCTGVGWDAFNHISFRACKEPDKLTGVDGKQLPWDATKDERKGAYQYMAKCIDYDDFIDAINAQTGNQLDLSDIEDAIDELKDLQN